MPTTLNIPNIEVDNSNLVITDQQVFIDSDSHGTTPLADVDAESTVDTILGVKDGVVVQVGADDIGVNSADVSYSNTQSGLDATNVQTAIDKLKLVVDTRIPFGVVASGTIASNGGTATYSYANGVHLIVAMGTAQNIKYAGFVIGYVNGDTGRTIVQDVYKGDAITVTLSSSTNLITITNSNTANTANYAIYRLL